jgi:hypothetical protein
MKRSHEQTFGSCGGAFAWLTTSLPVVVVMRKGRANGLLEETDGKQKATSVET